MVDIVYKEKQEKSDMNTSVARKLYFRVVTLY